MFADQSLIFLKKVNKLFDLHRLKYKKIITSTCYYILQFMSTQKLADQSPTGTENCRNFPWKRWEKRTIVGDRDGDGDENKILFPCCNRAASQEALPDPSLFKQGSRWGWEWSWRVGMRIGNHFPRHPILISTRTKLFFFGARLRSIFYWCSHDT